MPMLPSGRHVAIDPEPLRNLLRDAANPSNAHRIMAIQSIDDLFSWLELLELVPIADAEPEQRDGAPPPNGGTPAGLLPRPTGRRLADWRVVAHDWTKADREAMATFIDERVRPHYASTLATVREQQDALLASPASLAGMFARMWQLGCHPLQDEPATDHPLPPQGMHARLAALRYAARLVAAHPELMAAHRGAADRLAGFVAMCGSMLAWPDPLPDESVGEYAQRLRTGDPLAGVDPERRAWFDAQTGIECAALWEAVGEKLRSVDRETYDVIELAALSRPANGTP